MERADLVKAKHGANGGYFLAKPSSKITPGDILIALEKNLAVVQCLGCPKAGGCKSQKVWNEVRQSLSKSLKTKTLADIVG